MPVTKTEWLSQIVNNPSITESLLADLDARIDSCYKRALDDLNASITGLRGERDAYIAIKSEIIQTQTKTAQPSLEVIQSQLFIPQS